MSGEVTNILAKDRVVRTAELTRGIISVQDRLTVKDTERSDPKISADLWMAFATNPATDTWKIDFDVHEGAVTLTGGVQSANERALATRVAKSVAGVRSVVNELEIEISETRPDAEIESEIEAVLHWDVRLADGLIDVVVEDSRAVLSGAVANVHEKELAIQHALTSRAAAVDADDLEVLWPRRDEMQRRTPWDEIGNDAVATAVERAMHRDARVSELDLSAVAEDRTITLTGMVDDYQAKQAAGEIARNVVGAQRVLNYVKVRPELALTDDEVAAAARAAIARDPIIADAGISLLVVDARAKLYGVVDGAFERAHAEAVVAGIHGVLYVQNYLATCQSLEEAPVISSAGRIQPQRSGTDVDWRTDAELRAAIKDRLTWSSYFDAGQIDVSVDNGTATLTGTVADPYELRKANESALEGGASRVVNQLRVDTE